MNTLITVLAGLIPLYIVRFSLGRIPTNLFELLVWGVFAFAVIHPAMRKQTLKAWSTISPYIVMWSALFVVSAVISMCISPIFSVSVGILKGWVITPILFALLVLAARKAAARGIISSVVYSGLVVALLGISQIQGFTRITGIYDVPNSFALFVVPICVLAYWVGIQKKDRFYVLSAFVMFIATLYTQSFGAIIALGGTFVLGVIISPQIVRKSGAALLMVIAILCMFMLSGRISYLVSPLLSPATTNSATVRIQLWDIGIRLIKKHSILGVGLGQFEPAYQEVLHQLFVEQEKGLSSTFYSLQSEYVFRDPHNWIISFWLNMGLLGLISFIALNYFALKRIKNASIYQQAAILAIVSMLIFGLFDTIYWKNDLSALWWLLILFI